MGETRHRDGAASVLYRGERARGENSRGQTEEGDESRVE